MTIDLELQDLNSNISNAESVKLLVLNKLLKDGIIKESDYNTYSSDYNIIVINPSWYKKWMNKFKRSDVTGFIYKYVKF